MKQQPTGPRYWQSLNALSDTPAVREAISKEFVDYDPSSMLSTTRRTFLKFAGASMALAGITLTGCRRWPKENLVPHTSRPEGRIPGVPEQYASVMELGGFGQPLLITTYDGRPIKIEGNPLHPISQTFGGKLGCSTMFAQASLLDMYDPERSRAISRRISDTHRQPVSLEKFASEMRSLEPSAEPDGADGQKGIPQPRVAVLAEETRSPLVRDMLDRLNKSWPGGVAVFEYEAVGRDNQADADAASFGQPVRQLFDAKKARVVVSFDADILGLHPGALRYANDWAQQRRGVDADKFEDKSMNRLYVVESMYSTTGSVADERLPVRASRIESMVAALAARVLGGVARGLQADEQTFVDRIYADLTSTDGNAIVVGGPHLSVESLQAINSINEKLGAFGKTISLIPEVNRPKNIGRIDKLVEALNNKQYGTLILLGGNPVYDAPTDLNFRNALANCKTSVHLSLYDNETSHACTWHVNRAHYLESWGDAEAYDGTISIQQPTILPLFNGLTPASLLAVLLRETPASVLGVSPEQAIDLTLDQAVLYRAWAARLGVPFAASSPAFREALHDGFLKDSAAPIETSSIRVAKSGDLAATSASSTGNGKYEVRFVPDYKMYDGRFANNGWLQEVPDPITKISWDNVALISYADAQTLGVEQNDYETGMVSLQINGRELEIPAYVLPGQPKGMITLPLGYGREQVGGIVLTENPGSIGCDIGYDTYQLRTTKNMHVLPDVSVKTTGRSAQVATVQTQHHIEPGGVLIRAERVGEKSLPGMIVHESTLKSFVESHGSAPHSAAHKLLPLQLFPEPYTTPKIHADGRSAFNQPHAWGMAIDMNTCIGCNACVVACQAENNIPVVGKEMVIRGREMHWLRIDRYFKATGDTYEEIITDPNPQITYQPMMCVHCENAPCEQVCPVAATVHDSEGLNAMVYNRCIGTRYCSNNCPYKVRRFNYLDYQSKHPREGKFPWLGIPDTQQEQSVDKVKRLVFNPEVTVRMRGVMEKCTYCVQRIKTATQNKKNNWEKAGSTPVKKEDGRAGYTVDDFDIVTACQQACPTETIVFGDLNDRESLVSRRHADARAYAVLQELNNRPRTYHMAKLRNPVNEPVGSAASENNDH